MVSWLFLLLNPLFSLRVSFFKVPEDKETEEGGASLFFDLSPGSPPSLTLHTLFAPEHFSSLPFFLRFHYHYHYLCPSACRCLHVHVHFKSFISSLNLAAPSHPFRSSVHASDVCHRRHIYDL